MSRDEQLRALKKARAFMRECVLSLETALAMRNAEWRARDISRAMRCAELAQESVDAAMVVDVANDASAVGQ